MTWFHIHKWWFVYVGRGWLEKQEGQQNITSCAGDIEICRCKQRRLVPHDKVLYPVFIS